MNNTPLKYDKQMAPVAQKTLEMTAAAIGKTVGVALVIYDGSTTEGPHIEYYSNMKGEVLLSVIKQVFASVNENTTKLPTLGSC